MLPGEDRAARRVLLVCMAAGATTLLDQAVLNIAVPRMRQSIGATGADIQWIVAGYSLAFGLALVPGGAALAVQRCPRPPPAPGSPRREEVVLQPRHEGTRA